MRDKFVDRVTRYQAQYDLLAPDNLMKALIGDALHRAIEMLEKHDAEQAKIDRLNEGHNR